MLRILLTALILSLSLGAGPRVAAGNGVVLCGADGAVIVAYDFEKAMPVEPAPVFHDCLDCVGLDALSGCSQGVVVTALLPETYASSRAADYIHGSWRASARGPPLSLI
ncbi:MAG: hypothetical protein AAF401_18210 [Pseudomonadota bacterium]